MSAEQALIDRHADATKAIAALVPTAHLAFIDASSLAKLLVRKGLASELEALQALAEGMEGERARLEEINEVKL